MLAHVSAAAVLLASSAPPAPWPPPATPPLAPTPLVQRAVDAVEPQRLGATVRRLAEFGTRHALSTRDDPARGIGAAANWLKAQLDEIAGGTDGRLTVRLEEFDAPTSPRLPEGARLINVVAELKAPTPQGARRAYYVVGHYDSRNGETMDAQGDAPGANDDASGTAVVLEAARVLAALPPLDSTVVFLITSAEEAGLVGAKLHAEALARDKPYDVVMVLNNDIVGDPSPPYAPSDGGPIGPRAGIVRLFSEGLPRGLSPDDLAKVRGEGAESDAPSRQLARFVRSVWARELAPRGGAGTPPAFRTVEPVMVFRQDRFLRGGDHAAFNDAGFAGVRFSVPAEDYSRQHANVAPRDGAPYGDVPALCDGAYMAGVAAGNLASLIHLANAPRPPARARALTANLEASTTLRWDASPEPDTAGYEVVWRETTASDWSGSIDVGAATEASLPLSKDNVFFGVRAYDRDGYRSPVAFAWAAKE